MQNPWGSDRLQRRSRLHRGRRLEFLGLVHLPLDLLVRAAHAVVLRLAAYGWVGRLPTWGQGNKLFNGVTRAHCACRMANRKLRMVLYGAKTRLDIIVGSRLLSRVSSMKLTKGHGGLEQPGNEPMWTFAPMA